MDAATVEFGRLGYAGAALSAVAAQSDVSKPLVLNYFGSKDGLYVACVDRAGRNLIERIETVLASDGPPLRLAGDTLAAIFAGLEARPHDWNVINDRTLPPGSPAYDAARTIRSTISEQAARGVSLLADLPALADADDVSMLTDVWMNVVTACVNWWLRHPDRSVEEMGSRSRRLIAAVTGQPVND